MTLKGHANFQPKLNPAFQINTKKICQFVSSGQKESKFQNLLLLFLRKVNSLNQNTFPWVLFCGTEGPWKVWAKTESCFPNQSKKACSICFQWAKAGQLSYFIALFCVKGKFLQPKTSTGVLLCDTEGPWKVWAKTESCFPNQPKTN